MPVDFTLDYQPERARGYTPKCRLLTLAELLEVAKGKSAIQKMLRSDSRRACPSGVRRAG